MTKYDYGVLVFYFLYMLAISWVFRRFVSNVSDYFRGGGKAVWWMVGGSAFMVQFSAWTFTGAASKAYTDGWPIAVIFLGNVFGFVLAGLFFAPRFRQLRVITSIEAVRLRFGKASEHVYTWLQLPFGTLQAGVWLNSLAVFISAVFGIDVEWTIWITGLSVLFIALVGGSWAVLASDFIQVLILMPIALAVTVLGVVRVGGLDAWASRLPATHLDLSQAFSTEMLGLWCLAMLLKQLQSNNNLLEANRYLCVKDGSHARRAGIFGAALFILGIVIWFVPPMTSAILFPDLATEFPQLKNPAEGAFIAISRAVMPVGMMGLLVSGIFAATMSSMDTGLNKNAGIFIKNFYQPVVKPAATDQQLLVVGKFATAILGLLVILLTMRLNAVQGLGLFRMMQTVSIMIGVPILVPLFFGLFVKNTPPWSGWSTVLVGFLSSILMNTFLTPDANGNVPGFATTLTGPSRGYWIEGMGLFINIGVAATWFVGTKLFWGRCSAAEKARVEEFFRRFNTPIDFHREEGEANDQRQAKVVGWLCVAYGSFVALLAAIPNPAAGRIAFLGCGGLVLTIGGLLLRSARGGPAIGADAKPAAGTQQD